MVKSSWLPQILDLMVSIKVSEEHTASIFSAEVESVRMW